MNKFHRLQQGKPLLFVLAFFMRLTVAWGQEQPFFEGEPSGDERPWYHISFDRNLMQKMNTVVEFGEKDRPLEAAMAMQAVIEHPSDYFLMLETNRYRSTRQYVRSWVEQQPKEVLKAYEVQYGAVASNLLKQFRRTGDRKFLLQIVQKYLHTKSGISAAYRLACLELDEGRFLAAAMNFERLSELQRVPVEIKPWIAIKSAFCWMKLGQEKRAQQILQQYQRDYPQKTILIGGQAKSFQQIIDSFLEQSSNKASSAPRTGRAIGLNRSDGASDWPMFRRTASRDKLESEFSPLPLVQWNIDLMEQLLPDNLPRKELVRDLLRSIFRELESEKYTTLPALNPILVDGRLMVSAFGTVAAFSVEDGHLLWKSSLHDRVLEYLQSEELLAKLAIQGPGGMGNYELYLIQQAVGDLTTGTLSSDGTHLFAIRECGIINGYSRGSFQTVEDFSVVPNHANRLSALDVKTGRVLWEVGGVLGGQNQKYSGHFFLGPPVIVDGDAFLLSENGGQIFLSQLDAGSGSPLWMQPLAIPQVEILLDGPRRLSGISPTFHDPYLICSTNAGTVFAVDLESKELRWSFIYKQNSKNRDEPSPFGGRRPNPARSPRLVSLSQMLYGSHWQDFIPLVAGNYLLVTPVDSDDLFCLDLFTGKLLWSEIRRDGLYIEVVNRKDVLIIGKQTLRSLDVKTGLSNWPRSVSLAPAAGRGVQRGSVYQLPTLSDGLYSYDIETGTLLATTGQGESFFQPGNLLVAGDQLLTVRNGRLIALQRLHQVQESIKQKLQSNPGDALTLSLKGQLELHLGHVQSGLALLQKSYRIKRLPETARQITKTILNADEIVLTDQEIAELSEMMVSAEHSTEIVLRYVKALQQHHKSVEALLVLRDLIESQGRADQMIAISGDRRVRAVSLTKGIVRDIFSSADQLQKEKLDAEISDWFRQANDSKRLAALEIFCASRKLSQEYRLNLVRHFVSQLSPLQLERHLLWLKENGTPAQQAEATARLAQLFISLKKYEEAVIYLHELNTVFGRTVCLNEQTGGQLVAAWRGEEKALDDLANVKLQGLVLDRQYQVSVQPEEVNHHLLSQQLEVKASHPAGSPWEFWSFRISPQGPQLTAYSAVNKPEFAISLEGVLRSIRVCSIQSEGHLIVFSNEGSLVGIDGFGKVLWNEKFGDVSWDSPVLQEPFVGQNLLTKLYGVPIGEMTPIKDHQFACRLGSKIYLKQADSGKVLWEFETNSAVPLSMCMDGENVYLINPNNRRILPLRLDDGEPGRLTQLPPHQQILAMQGSVLVLFNRVTPEKGILIGYDLTNQKVVWNQTLSTEVSIDIAGNGLLAVHDTGKKKLHVLDPVKVNPVLFQVDTPETSPSKLFVHSDPAHWYFHLTTESRMLTQPLDNQSPRIVNGPVIAVSKKTKKVIWTQKIDNLRWLSNQPASLPFLIYAALSPGTYLDDNEKEQTGYLPKIKLVHKQSGKELNGIPAGFTGLLIAMKHDFTKQKFKLLFRTGTILIEEKKLEEKQGE